MRKALLLLISILMICTMFTMVSCENNVYLPGNDTWCVQDMYFQTFGEALAWLMGQGGGASRDLIQSDIPENQTIYLMRDVPLSENAGAIEVPASFAGSLCIDFRGHEYWFSSKTDKFFNIQGGDRIDIINGKTIISNDASSGSKAVIVNVNTVTIDDHLVDDRRPNPQAIEVGPKGVLVIKSASNNRTDSVLNGAFDIQTGGELRITGGVFRIDSIADPASMTGLVITGGVISNPHELSVYVDAAIAVGGHPENVQTNVIHDISDLWIQIDPEKHYKTCSGCTQHFEEGPHEFTDWVYDSNFNGQRQCKICGRVEYMDHVHTLVFHPAKDPTCTVPGNIAYYGCEICGKNYLNAEGTIAADDVILTKPHTLTHHDAVAPTCTENGNIEYWTCDECHQYFTDAAGTTVVPSTGIVDPATDHAWGEWTVVTPATCTTTGLKQRVCANDETHIEQEVIPVTSHNLSVIYAVEPTCTTEGNIKCWICEDCGKYFSDADGKNEITYEDAIIPALGHSMSDLIAEVPASCEATGTKAHYHCATCGKDFADADGKTEIENLTIPATGHTWSEQWSSDSTHHWHACDNCDAVKDKDEHTLGEWTYNPETGKMDNVCTVCQKEFHQDHVHNESNLTYHTAVAHTCTADGTKEYYSCSDCNQKFILAGITFIPVSDEDLIDPAAHSLTKVEAKAATCETAGNIAYWKCDVCEKLFSDALATTEVTAEDVTIAATGHDWGEWVVITPATCTVPGSETRTCANDATHAEVRPIASTGHTMTELIAEVPATCEETGTKAHYHCETCGKDFADADGKTEITDLTIPATGHVSLTKTEGVAATCIEDGFETYWTCDECGQKFSDAEGKTKIANPIVIPATGHDMTYVPAVAATCTTDGNVEYWHCENCELDFADEEGEETLEVTVIPATGHHTDDAHHVAAKDATCMEAGNAEYWTCKDCGKYFTDAELTTEEPAEFFVIPALGHAKVHYEAVAATCTATGNVEFWHCTRCGKNYADEDCTIELETVTTQMIAHALTHHEAVAPTCVDDGNIEYWTCDVCNKFFADANGTEEIEEDDTVDEATGSHTLTTHDAVDATCVATGNSLYYECTVCGKYFSDEACEHEVEEDSWITAIDPDNHSIEYVDAVAPTETKHGNTEYWHCTRCDKYFSDEDLEDEITLEDTVVHNWSEAWTHDVIDNGHYHWHVCTVEDCEETTEPEACTVVYEHDTEGHEGKHRQICDVCKAEITEWTDHVWGGEIKHDDEKDLDYVECICGARLYDELYEVTIGEVSYTVGENAPAGTMQIVDDEGVYIVSYAKADEDDLDNITIRCHVYIDGVWNGKYLEDNQQGIYEITPGEGSTYKVVLEAANATGISIFEKIIGL